MASPAALVTRAAELGMPAVALTDRDGLYGAFKHAQACANAGIKPLLGTDLALAGLAPDQATARRKAEREPNREASRRAAREASREAAREAAREADREADRAAGRRRITLLAVARRGWASLCRLVSAAHAAGRREDPPAVTQDMIAEHANGLVVLLGPDSDVGQLVAARRPDAARKALNRWRSECDTVVEVVNHMDLGGTFRAARMAELAEDTRTPAVLTNAVRYLDPADSRAAQVLDAARHLVPLGSPRLVPHNGREYLASQADMAVIAERVAGDAARHLLRATAELAETCALDPARDLGIGAHHLPETQVTPGAEQQELRARCELALLH